MVAGHADDAAGGSFSSRSTSSTSDGPVTGIEAPELSLGQMLDAESVEEVVGWVDRLLGSLIDEKHSMAGKEHGERRRVAIKLKRLDVLKRAVEKAEVVLRRRQETLTLNLVPGLSDHFCQSNQGRYPLSYAQQQMLALQHMQPESAAYNVVRAVRMSKSSRLDVRALTAAVDALLVKHEGLRMLFGFDPISGEAFQKLVSSESVTASASSVLSATIWGEEVCKFQDDHTLADFVASNIASTPFNLANELPIRVVAISSDEESEKEGSDWTLVTVIHHIVTDSVSSAVIWRDLMHTYTSLASKDVVNERADNPMASGPVVQYRDYAVWQRERVDSGLLDPSIQYWTAQLASSGEAQSLNLPIEKLLPASVKGADVVTFQAPYQAVKRMVSLCRSSGCTLFMGLLAVFYELLARLAGSAQPDITIGSPVSIRDREELQQVVGYFVNTLPLRIQPKKNKNQANSFMDLLEVVRGVVLGAFAHVDVPFHVILERLHRSGSSSSNDAGHFQVMFALETADSKDDDPTLHIGNDVVLPRSAAKFDLMLTMRAQHSSTQSLTLEGEMEFSMAKFSREAVERFTHYYSELLVQLTQSPNKPLSNISMIPIDEQRLIISKWGAPPNEDECDSIHTTSFIDECLHTQVRKTPDNWALHFESESWTYSTLWRESGRVYRAISQIGGGEQLRVGIFQPRGLLNAASVIGAMRSRAVFVPLDALFPPERIRYMIADAKLHAVVTLRSHQSRLSELLQSSVQILVYEDLPLQEDGCVDDCCVDNHPDPPAYILYTSGSTGSPKGVVISHSNLLTTLWWTVAAYKVSPRDVFLQSTSTTLDGSLTQLLSPLLVGGAAVITRDGGLHDLDYIRSLLAAPPPRAVTYCVFVPSYLSTILDHTNNQRCFPPTVKYVVIVGEAFPMELARRFYRIHDGTTTCLINEYGPTEASVTSTFLRLPSSESDALVNTVPIGRPIWGRRVLVLDEWGRLVPPHVCGELLLGGPGVSKMLIPVWQQVLDLNVVDANGPWRHKSFFDLGGDSLAAIRAISIARARGLALTLDMFFTSTSVDDMAARVFTSTDLASLTSRPLVPLNVSPVSNQLTTLFLVHCADGTVWKFRELASLLPFRVVGVQATINDPADAVNNVEALASKYWSEIRVIQPNGPYALGGFSFGCRVAHAIARLAVRAGHSLWPLTLIDGAPFYANVLENVASSTSDVEAYVIETFGGQRPSGTEAELFQQLADQFRSHCAMDDAYYPMIDPAAPTDPLLSAVVYKTDKWEVDAVTLQENGVAVESVTIAGATHLTMLRRPHVTDLAHAIRMRLGDIDQ